MAQERGRQLNIFMGGHEVEEVAVDFFERFRLSRLDPDPAVPMLQGYDLSEHLRGSPAQVPSANTTSQGTQQMNSAEIEPIKADVAARSDHSGSQDQGNSAGVSVSSSHSPENKARGLGPGSVGSSHRRSGSGSVRSTSLLSGLRRVPSTRAGARGHGSSRIRSPGVGDAEGVGEHGVSRLAGMPQAGREGDPLTEMGQWDFPRTNSSRSPFSTRSIHSTRERPISTPPPSLPLVIAFGRKVGLTPEATAAAAAAAAATSALNRALQADLSQAIASICADDAAGGLRSPGSIASSRTTSGALADGWALPSITTSRLAKSSAGGVAPSQPASPVQSAAPSDSPATGVPARQDAELGLVPESSFSLPVMRRPGSSGSSGGGGTYATAGLLPEGVAIGTADDVLRGMRRQRSPGGGVTASGRSSWDTATHARRVALQAVEAQLDPGSGDWIDGGLSDRGPPLNGLRLLETSRLLSPESPLGLTTTGSARSGGSGGSLGARAGGQTAAAAAVATPITTRGIVDREGRHESSFSDLDGMFIGMRVAQPQQQQQQQQAVLLLPPQPQPPLTSSGESSMTTLVGPPQSPVGTVGRVRTRGNMRGANNILAVAPARQSRVPQQLPAIGGVQQEGALPGVGTSWEVISGAVRPTSAGAVIGGAVGEAGVGPAPLGVGVGAVQTQELAAVRAMWSSLPYSSSPPASQLSPDLHARLAAAAEQEFRDFDDAASALADEFAAALIGDDANCRPPTDNPDPHRSHRSSHTEGLDGRTRMSHSQRRQRDPSTSQSRGASPDAAGKRSANVPLQLRTSSGTPPGNASSADPRSAGSMGLGSLDLMDTEDMMAAAAIKAALFLGTLKLREYLKAKVRL
ncbi:MAG: hypothetical protein WDW38_004036 [Sanguina aurantia]